jgi:flagellar motor component MotA
MVRKQGLLGLEPMIEQYDPFVRKGMQMLVDGVEPDTIRRIMEIDIDNREDTTPPLPRCSKAWACMRRHWASSARCSA